MKSWNIKAQIDDEIKNDLGEYSSLVKQLLFNRGIKKREQAEKFLNPKYADLHDPFLILNMDKAVDRVLSAIDKGEKIGIYGDYDCDGIPGSTVLHDFFQKIGYNNFVVYIPHRYKEGYGLNVLAIEKLAQEGVSLLITVDCGITDVEPVDVANNHGMDVIITDHHLVQEQVPKAYAILNSKQNDDSYPFDMLCGAGVAFKLVQGLLKKRDFGLEEGWEKWLLDAVGLSTVADMVPLHGENRTLAWCGLEVLKRTKRPGLLKLFDKNRIDRRYLNEDDIGFNIAPFINAASRMGDPIMGFKLLSTKDESEAGNLASYLDEKNRERKSEVKSMIADVESRVNPQSDVVVVGHEDWLPGIVGLAAHKIAEKYKKVVFVWGRKGSDCIRGSCRSNGFVNMVDLMSDVKDLFLDFGGHALAGGFAVKDDKLSDIEKALNDSYKKLANSSQDVSESLDADARLSVDDINEDLYFNISKLAPFGMNNPKPTFVIEAAYVSGVKRFGNNREHLSMSLLKSNGKSLEAIAFNFEGDSEELPLEPGKIVDILGTVEKTYFRGRPELRLRILDIRKSF